MTFSTSLHPSSHHGHAETLQGERSGHTARHSKSETMFYYLLFSILFAVFFTVFVGASLMGKAPKGGVIEGAKRAASGPAGYAVNC